MKCLRQNLVKENVISALLKNGIYCCHTIPTTDVMLLLPSSTLTTHAPNPRSPTQEIIS